MMMMTATVFSLNDVFTNRLRQTKEVRNEISKCLKWFSRLKRVASAVVAGAAAVFAVAADVTMMLLFLSL